MFALGLDLKHRRGKVIGSDALRKQHGPVVGVVMVTVISHHTTGLSPCPVTWVKLKMSSFEMRFHKFQYFVEPETEYSERR